MNNYYDMTRDVNPNQHAYRFWRDKVRARINDPATAELLAPTEAPHPFGAKRLSLEQDFYEQFNRPNINVVDIKTHPIVRFEPEGILTADGTFHKLDVIALATGFDSITGGLKDIEIRGLGGELLADKWDRGTWTYLGMTTARMPNFFFTYGKTPSSDPSTIALYPASLALPLIKPLLTASTQFRSSRPNCLQ